MKEMLSESLAFYAQPGRMTDPGMHGLCLNGLPTSLPELVETVQGLLLHIFWAERYGVQLSEERMAAVNVRPLDRKLALLLELDDRPLTEARLAERRLVGNCRDFSLVLAACLRYQGVPARARCGFGTYFIPGHYEDHWVCEYWKSAGEDGGRWVRVDAQLDALQRQALGIQFDPLDLPPGQFISGGQAWKMCRGGEADPANFGILDMSGMMFIWGNVIRDLLALNKIEILPWDGGWGYLTRRLEDPLPVGEELEKWDCLAALTLAGADRFEELRAVCENDEGLQLPEGWDP